MRNHVRHLCSGCIPDDAWSHCLCPSYQTQHRSGVLQQATSHCTKQPLKRKSSPGTLSEMRCWNALHTVYKDEFLTVNCLYIRVKQADGQFRGQETASRGTQRWSENSFLQDYWSCFGTRWMYKRIRWADTVLPSTWPSWRYFCFESLFLKTKRTCCEIRSFGSVYSSRPWIKLDLLWAKQARNYFLKNKGSLLVSVVPQRTFNIHRTFPIHKRFIKVEKGS